MRNPFVASPIFAFAWTISARAKLPEPLAPSQMPIASNATVDAEGPVEITKAPPNPGLSSDEPLLAVQEVGACDKLKTWT